MGRRGDDGIQACLFFSSLGRVVGTVDAQRSIDIHPSVEGQVVALTFKPEQRVRRGECWYGSTGTDPTPRSIGNGLLP